MNNIDVLPPPGRCGKQDYCLAESALDSYLTLLKCIFYTGYTQCRDVIDQRNVNTELFAWTESAVNKPTTCHTVITMEDVTLESLSLDDIIKSEVNESTKSLTY